MKNLSIYNSKTRNADVLRIWNQHYASLGDDTCGCFEMMRGHRTLIIIASSGEGWQHVSVSANTMPTWEEMCAVKDAFFNDEEWVMQFHPAKSEYVNNHGFCLHLWRPNDGIMPTPPSRLVGIKKAL